jgi:hypothetical protein
MTLPDFVKQGRDDSLEALSKYVLKKIEDFIQYIGASGGILALDWRVCTAVDSDTEHNPPYYPTGSNIPIRLPSGMMSMCNQ